MSVPLRVLLCAIALCGASCGSPEPAPAPSEAEAPVVPSGPRLYITNEISGDLSVIDLATNTVTATIPLGKRPRGLQVGPDGLVYVALSGSPIGGPNVDESTLPPPDRSADGIGVVDVAAGKVLRVLTSGTDPEKLALSLDGSLAFVANEDAALTSIIDIARNEIVGTVPVGGEPEGADTRPDGKVVYITSEEDSEVFVIDVETKRLVTKFAVDPRPRSTAFLPDSSRAYVACENGGSISVVDAMKHEVIGTIRLEGENARPMGEVVSPDGRFLYVTTGRGRMLVAIDTSTNAVVWSVEVGERPWGVAISPDGGTLYTANGPSNDVSVVDVATRSVTARIPVGVRPWGALVAR
ncbi:MAG: hypothetical protein FJ038_13790 [Chloroflexi bacterium]|nr:hypothetical protein [Chloroflexota bacterium]